VYLRARWYAVGQGRFLTKDTWEGDYQSPLTLNRWNYVQSNPINYQDPTGNFRIPCPPGWRDWEVDSRVDEAEKYVFHTSDPMNTYVAAGIAIQCAGWDNPLNPNSGVGIAQITKNEVETELESVIPLTTIWGTIVYQKDKEGNYVYDENGNPKPEVRSYGLRKRCPNGELEPARDPNDPKDAVTLMKRRIEMVTDHCDDCTATDIYIAAALAQNGSGFTYPKMQKVPRIKPNRIKFYKNPKEINRDWFLYFEWNSIIDTKTQLIRFDMVIVELRSRRWIVPFIDTADIEELKK
jgi:hypothetical protein